MFHERSFESFLVKVVKEFYSINFFTRFINHSETPNCEKSQVRIEPYWDKWTLKTTENIKKGEELTLKYTMYRVDKSK